MTSPILPIVGVAKRYDWGGIDEIPATFGIEADGLPYAEWWLGTHSAGPALLDDGTTLAEFAASNPDRFGPAGSLPFLLKVLSVARPLSIQVHPSLKQAAAGFRRENDASVDVDAPTRVYRDPNHKPELICAVTPFEALCGFVTLDDATRSFRALNSAMPGAFDPLLRASAGGFDQILRSLFDASTADLHQWTRAIAGECGRLRRPELAGIAELYPSDPGVVVALLLNHFVLQPGESLFLEAGVLHAYLGGFGVEVMAESDNVVRGGLTSKHVDVPELLRILAPEAASKRLRSGDSATTWSPVPDFSLTRIPAKASAVLDTSPIIVVCLTGAAELRVVRDESIGSRRLRAGESAFVGTGWQTSIVVDPDGLVFAAGPGHQN